jgi:hypothetical protein
MTESRDALTTTTVGAAEEARDYVNRVVNAWSEASERYVRTLQQFAPTGQAGQYQAPNPKALLDASYEVAQQALELQHQMLSQAYERFGQLFSRDEEPAPEKATQQANEAGQQAQQATRSAAESGSTAGSSSRRS